MSMESPLARVRGLGSAKEGSGHWRTQRLTAIALVPLVAWMMIALVGNTAASHDDLVAWLRQPVSAGLMIAALLALFWHAQLGLQVVIEDYVHVEWAKYAALIGVRLAAVALGLIAAVSVLKISLGV